ncbi:MAG: phosphoribosylformylglycinamidine synthase [Oscillospiraceae bacterium]|jgi:phosphoribosylformylglycinamidine synthase|nr:phosphoribosylformylglycinamidine synthase [Oscillospiraceae bacterium]
MVLRIYSEKRPEYAVEAGKLKSDIVEQLGIPVASVRILCRYDIEGLSKDELAEVAPLVFYEPPLDFRYDELPETTARVFAYEALPGQFDQRADAAAECVQLILGKERPAVKCAGVVLIEETEEGITDEQFGRIIKYVVNPVDSGIAELTLPDTLALDAGDPPPVAEIAGFNEMDEEALTAMVASLRLALEPADLLVCQKYFRKEGREPTQTELAVLDAYWSDHCRHTTMGAVLTDVKIEDEAARKTWERFLELRGNKETPPTLMEVATFGAKLLRRTGREVIVDESEEINACTVPITVNVDGKDEPWLLLFKNETHNHPTEIEPFGGAATCIGGAIRDPLSGRAYVYQSMRITGAADPTEPVLETLPGKLPQRKLCQVAAAGFSSYGNQIGLATGYVREYYHPGYKAKRMELGAVVGAAPASHVRREVPRDGDVVILIGGRTGRDGIGGASGSSKAHARKSVDECGSQVQKGNAPTERKLQRLFRSGGFARLVKRCNDFGAGGVCVAIGELADGLEVNLDAVPLKYKGLSGTEIAVSESQERMAVVVSKEDADAAILLANAENLEATVVARVTDLPRLVMRWRGQTVVDMDRGFLSSNGAARQASARIRVGEKVKCIQNEEEKSIKERYEEFVGSLNIASQQGLSERFDSTIGAGTILMPFGGFRQSTPNQTMAALIPGSGSTDACSGMAAGFDPYRMEENPYRGAFLSVCESVMKLVCAGFSRKKAYLTLQEYFPRPGGDPEKWGNVLAALLGALAAQDLLSVAAIGGKDSMSGTFENIEVPPTLVSFAVASGSADNIISTEFKKPGDSLYLVGADPIADPEGFVKTLDWIEDQAEKKNVSAAWVMESGGLAEALFKMGQGNVIGTSVECDPNLIFADNSCRALVALKRGVEAEGIPGIYIGWTTKGEAICIDKTEDSSSDDDCLDDCDINDCNDDEYAYIYLDELIADSEGRFGDVFPTATWEYEDAIYQDQYKLKRTNRNLSIKRKSESPAAARPRVLIPVFPGTNCETDMARAFEREGAVPEIIVVRNLTPTDIADSVKRVADALSRSQILALAGGFSSGDEPEGSAKMIAAFFRNPYVADALADLLDNRDGLALGICNGFQALVKLGLLPYGKITKQGENSPTLTYNRIGRHQSMMVRTKIFSKISPWLSLCKRSAVYQVPISHGEGRFVASEDELVKLHLDGQVCLKYVDEMGAPTLCEPWNPNGSMAAIESICSPDGRILGKMGHTERAGVHLYKNVRIGQDMPLFEGGVSYFR